MLNKYIFDRRIRIFIFLLTLVSIFSFILFLNIRTPMMGDDFTYAYIFSTTNKLENLSDIIQSQYNHYKNWGGRVIVHAVAQVLLLLPPLSADIINSLAFVALLILIYLFINYKNPLNTSLFIGIFLLMWFLTPFGETVLWITGSANYMWGIMLILAFLFIYSNYKNQKINVFVSIAIFIFGIIAGWTNENTGASLIVMIILFLLYYKKQKWDIPLWAYSGLAGVLIGYIFMIAAPGNTVRAGTLNSEITLHILVYRFLKYSYTFITTIGILNFAYIVLFYIVYKEKKENYKQVLLKSLIFEIGTFASIYSMLLSPSFPDRAWFGVITYNIIAVGILLAFIDNLIIRYVKYGFIGVGLLVFILNSYKVLDDIFTVEKIHIERNRKIIDNKGTGKTIYFTPYENKTKYSLSDPYYAVPMVSILYEVKIEYK